MKILLVRLREIGDVVFTTPAISAIRRRFPDARISYVVEPHAAAVVAHNPNLNDVIVARRRRGPAGLAGDIMLGRRLRRASFQLAIDFHGGPRGSLLTWLSGAATRIGYDTPGRGWMYTARVPRPREIRPRHAVQNQWDLLAPLGIPASDAPDFPVEMPPDPSAVSSVAARLAGAGIGHNDRVIVVHVSAGNPFRRWPLPAFSTVIAMLALRDARRRVVVTSGPSDRHAAARAIEQARSLLEPAEASRIAACTEFSLDELRALMDRAALFIGGDSGPMHIAATSTVPIVGLYGPTLPVRSQPWRAPGLIAEAVGVEGLPCRPCDQRRCVPGDYRCLGWLRPEHVIEAAERALST